MLVLDDKFAQLPTTTFPSAPILNIHAHQFGYIQGRPNETFDRGFHTRFFVPGKGNVKDVFAVKESVETPFTLRAAEYQSRVAKDAVEALNAIDKHRAKQAYFDELDKDNIFPRPGRSVKLDKTTSSRANGDGSSTIFHQPSWIRQQQNQFIGDSSRNVKIEDDNTLPDKANMSERNTILGGNKVVTKMNNRETMTDEIGRIGASSRFSMSSGSTQTDIPEHRVRDMRTVTTQSEMPDLDSDTLDLIFANGGKFQHFMDGVTHANETLQTQLRSQEQQLGNMATATMATFRRMLESVGFSDVPATMSPDDMERLLKQVQSINPVALNEVAAMRTLIDTLKKEKMTESQNMGTQYSPTSSPKSAKHRPSPIITKNLAPTINYPSATGLNESDIFSSRSKSTLSSGKLSTPMSAENVPLEQFVAEEPVLRTFSTAGKTPSPTQTDIFTENPAVRAPENTPSSPIRKRKSTRTTAGMPPERLSYDKGKGHTSKRTKLG